MDTAYKKLQRGEITFNEFRKKKGLPPIPDCPLGPTIKGTQSNSNNISADVSKFIISTFLKENPDPTEYSTAVKLLSLQMEDGHNLRTAELELLKQLQKKNRTLQETASMPELYALVRRYSSHKEIERYVLGDESGDAIEISRDEYLAIVNNDNPPFIGKFN